MKPKIEDRDRSFVQTLQSLGPASVNELCDELGVTATSVRQRLARLEASEFVERERVSHGRGRPVYRFQVTSDGLRALGSNYAELAVLLWSELSAIEDQPTRDRIFDNLRSKLVARLGGADSGENLVQRVDRLAGALNDTGRDVGVGSQGDLPILKGCSCPYPDISQHDNSICELEREVYAEVLGADIELRARCVDGHSCCEFAVSEKAG